MKIRTNENQLVKIAVEGKTAPALAYPNSVGHDGRVDNLPASGGITYNVLVGDPAFGWAADHVEPCVSSIVNPEKRTDRLNAGYNFLACIGNDVRVVSGDAKGSIGTVTGHHGGMEHVLIDFAPSVAEKLTLSDIFQIRTFGQGLKLLDHPEIKISSLDPKLLAKFELREKSGQLEVPVAAILPAVLLGSGTGEHNVYTGDIDIITSDKSYVKKYGVDELKLGDIIAFEDCDASYGWRILKGAYTIAVVIHGDSNLSGHGPGTTAIMSCATGKLKPYINKSANIGRYLKIGRYRAK